MDLEAEYNNRARVPGHPAVMRRWQAEADGYRAAHPPRVVAYGPGERERMDLFPAGDGGAWVMFIHGGYWQALDGGGFSWVARALNGHGVGVAIPTYDLCPQVRVGDIVEQMDAACDALAAETGVAPVVSGHSAGGQLAACLLSKGRARAAVAISGVFDLEPLIPTSLNAALRLDAAEARAASPIRWPVPHGAVLDCVVGGAESGEFLRQGRDMATVWTAAGAHTRFEALPGLDHFTVLDPLFDGNSALVRRLVELAKA